MPTPRSAGSTGCAPPRRAIPVRVAARGRAGGHGDGHRRPESEPRSHARDLSAARHPRRAGRLGHARRDQEHAAARLDRRAGDAGRDADVGLHRLDAARAGRPARRPARDHALALARSDATVVSEGDGGGQAARCRGRRRADLRRDLGGDRHGPAGRRALPRRGDRAEYGAQHGVPLPRRQLAARLSARPAMAAPVPAHARAGIVGGGIVGCSVAYHLTKLGWRDIVLLERRDLSCGTTWHAAGLVGQLRSSHNLTRLASYGAVLYEQLEAETGQATGFRRSGSISVARTNERMIELKRGASMAKCFGVDVEVISPAEAGRRWPLMRTDDLTGAVWIPRDGRTNPIDTTLALAKGARNGGAIIVENVTVTGIHRQNGAATGVSTDRGDIACDVVVNCAGLWGREVGRLAGVNGPESFTPDNRYMLGQAPELRNFFVAAGFNSVGIASAAGAGKALAEWIVGGEPSMDLWDVDIRRFMSFPGNAAYLRERTTEVVGLLYAMHWPFRQPVTARGVRRSAVHDRLAARGAVFGVVAGWERANWFATDGVEPRYVYTYGRQNWFPCAGAEHRAVREAVGLFDQSSLAKFRVQGPDATAVLQRLCANDVDVAPGRIVYTQMLNARGGIACDLTVTRLTEDAYLIVTIAAAATHDADWIRRGIGAARVQ